MVWTEVAYVVREADYSVYSDQGRADETADGDVTISDSSFTVRYTRSSQAKMSGLLLTTSASQTKFRLRGGTEEQDCEEQ